MHFYFPVQGIVIDDEAPKPAPEKFEAAKYSSGKVVTMKNLCLIIPLINFNQEFISFFLLKDDSMLVGNFVCSKCSLLVPSMVCCRIKNKFRVFLCRVFK